LRKRYPEQLLGRNEPMLGIEEQVTASIGRPGGAECLVGIGPSD
jgi:hypothetical protein